MWGDGGSLQRLALVSLRQLGEPSMCLCYERTRFSLKIKYIYAKGGGWGMKATRPGKTFPSDRALVFINHIGAI